MASTESTLICVTDVNDQNPRFIKPASNTTVQVPEDAEIGSTVIAVQAVGKEQDLSGQIRYRFKPLANGHYQTFAINNQTGAISLAKPLDRETLTLYELQVEAYLG